MRAPTAFRFRAARLRLVLFVLVMLAWPAGGALEAQQGREPYSGLDRYIERAMATWSVPGVAIAIVRNDSVIYARGYGLRTAGTSERVTDRTLFAIGSSSKAFTAAAIAMLVDSQKVSLDAPASAYLPDFQLFDPYATREMSVRDLLSHRSGLARGELSWYGSPYDRDEVVRRVRFLSPSWSFRSRFGYQNVMYIAAGQLVGRVAGGTWDTFTRERLFVPLGMTNSSTSITELPANGDVATPHALVNDTVRTIRWRNIDNAGPAGSINSSAREMAQWVRLQLGKGKIDGRQLISERMIEEMQSPQISIRIDSAARRLNPHTNLQTYGLGWFIQDYRGEMLVHHGGNIDGFSALVSMLPERNFGVVVLTNMNGSGLPTAVANRIHDLHLRAPQHDWSGNMFARVEELRARGREAQQRMEAQRVPDTKPSLSLAEYAGVYVDSLHGEIEIVEQDGTLRMSFGPNWQGNLEHWHYDTFRTRFDSPVLGPITMVFRLNAAAKVDDVVMDFLGPVTFKRRPDPSPARAAGR